jgi:CHAT domain-containing protein/Tfp pilus assembly protein PilF
MKFFLVHILIVANLVINPGMEGIAEALPGDPALDLKRAESYFQVDKYERALHYFGRAASAFKSQNNWKDYITAVAGQGYALVKLRKYDDAKILLDEALSVGGEKLGRSEETATVYYVYGVLLDYTNKPEESLSMHHKALDIRKSLLGPNHLAVSESYNGIGEVYRYTLRDYIEAEKYFELSVEVLERGTGGNEKDLYRTYFNLATTNRLMNDYERALGFAFKATETLQLIKPLDMTSFIRCQVIIANIYYDLEAFEKAIKYYRDALSLRLERKDMSSETARDYTNLSQAYIKTGNFSHALNCVDSALQIMTTQEIYDSAGIANIYMIKGKAMQESSRFSEAILNYHKSLDVQRTFSRQNRLELADLYRHFSSTMYKTEQYDSALQYIQKCIQSATGGDMVKLSGFSNPPYERLSKVPQLYYELAHKGSVLVKLAEKEHAIDRLKLAVECFELSDRLMDIYLNLQESENSKLLFAHTNYHIYESALDAIYKLYDLTRDDKYKEIAFRLEDKSKARILRQAVEDAREHAKRNIPDSILSQERAIKIKIAALENKLGSLANEQESDENARPLNVELTTLQNELAVWKESIKKRFPQYVADVKDHQEISLADLKVNLSKDVLFIEYFFGQDALYIFGAFRGKEELIRMQNKNLEKRIHEFCRLLSKGLQSENRHADFKNYTNLSFGLFEELLRPILKALSVDLTEEPLQMVVIPDGVLSLLPFQTLLVSKTDMPSVSYKALDYLVRYCAISYSFDAASPFVSNNPAKKNLLAFGWSDGVEQTANDLPGTYHELRAIADIVPGEFIMGADASKEAFLKKSPGHNILHLAIHGVSSDNDIYKSYLQFRDEKLYAHELYGHQVDANLTVLSACETGYGKVFTAEGVYSIARGFFYAGAKSLLMTLWPINDGENVPLISEFYKKVNEDEYSSSALRISQLGYLEQADELSAHPRHWAGLVLWGTYKEIKQPVALSGLYVIFIASIIITLGYLLIKVSRVLRADSRQRTADSSANA